MPRFSIPTIGLFLFFPAGAALACSSQQEVMAHFETVKNAYIAKAPTMTPEQFPIWTGHLEQFGEAMGQLDFAGACASLDAASVDLGFDIATIGTGADAAAETASSAGATASGIAAPTTEPRVRRKRDRSRPRPLW